MRVSQLKDGGGMALRILSDNVCGTRPSFWYLGPSFSLLSLGLHLLNIVIVGAETLCPKLKPFIGLL